MLSSTRYRAVLLFLTVLLPSARSQQVRADIRGEITDSTGAAVSGATIRVTNLATSTVTTAKSNESGNYSTPFLAPGSYELTVEASGFKKFVRQNITLQAQDKVRVDANLEIGDPATTVTVAGELSQLQTEPSQ